MVAGDQSILALSICGEMGVGGGVGMLSGMVWPESSAAASAASVEGDFIDGPGASIGVLEVDEGDFGSESDRDSSSQDSATGEEEALDCEVPVVVFEGGDFLLALCRSRERRLSLAFMDMVTGLSLGKWDRLR